MTARGAGAGERNRTVVLSLEGFSSTIELHPQAFPFKQSLFAKTRTDALAEKTQLSSPRAGERQTQARRSCAAADR